MTQVITPTPAPSLVVERPELAITPSLVVERLALAIKAMTDLVNGGQQLSELQKASLFAFKSLLSDYELSSKRGFDMALALERTILIEDEIGFMLEAGDIELYLGGSGTFYKHYCKGTNEQFEQTDISLMPEGRQNHILKTLHHMGEFLKTRRHPVGF